MASTPTPSAIPATTREALERIEKSFHLDEQKLHQITAQFVKEFGFGLSKYGEGMAMVPTFVTGVPNGTEKGTFLALDLGGTNLRVCEVTLQGDHKFTLRQAKYKVSDALKTGEATDLFDYMADSVDAFLTEHGTAVTDEEDLHLGLTFSFPVEQTALAQGKLLTWTKGFAAKNAVGNDVVELLQGSFNRKHIHVQCVALVNDTVGTLMSRAYLTGGCLLGAIFGTGTNGAYVEGLKKITKLQTGESAEGPGSKMIVNTEWGAFDNTRRVLPFTMFDNKVDRESINPRFQAFEKFISGMYLGEIARNLLLHLIDSSLLFNAHSTSSLNAHYGFDSALMSDIEGDAPGKFEKTRKVFVDMGFKPEQVTDVDCEIVQWACRTVAIRGARLSGCAVATVIKQTGHDKTKEDIEVGVDGSLVEHYPHFEERLRESLRILLGPELEKRVKIGMAKDGSGVGAALCALQASKQLKI